MQCGSATLRHRAFAADCQYIRGTGVRRHAAYPALAWHRRVRGAGPFTRPCVRPAPVAQRRGDFGSPSGSRTRRSSLRCDFHVAKRPCTPNSTSLAWRPLLLPRQRRAASASLSSSAGCLDCDRPSSVCISVCSSSSASNFSSFDRAIFGSVRWGRRKRPVLISFLLCSLCNGLSPGGAVRGINRG